MFHIGAMRAVAEDDVCEALVKPAEEQMIYSQDNEDMYTVYNKIQV